MKELTVTFTVDDEDADLLTSYYAELRVRKGKKFIKLSKAISERMGISGDVIDHINTVETDNTRKNLRAASYSQNLQNSNKRSDNTSGYKGVSWYKRRNKWQVKLCLNNKQIHLGLFDNVMDAALAYDKKAVELFGEYALTNFK
jgi:hypothetical protein